MISVWVRFRPDFTEKCAKLVIKAVRNGVPKQTQQNHGTLSVFDQDILLLQGEQG